MFSHCTTDKPEPHGTTARLKYATPKEEEVRKLSSSDLKDYAGGAAVGSGAGAGVVGAGIGALIGGIVGMEYRSWSWNSFGLRSWSSLWGSDWSYCRLE